MGQCCWGVVTAVILALAAYIWNLRKHRSLKELTKIMKDATDHRHKGKSRNFADEKEWIDSAAQIEKDAKAKAKELSHTAGSLLAWIDRLPDEYEDNEVGNHISHLDKIIERIQGLLERHA